MHIYAEIDMNSVRRDFGGLDNLLISANDVEFNDLLGEGILKLYVYTNIINVVVSCYFC